MAKKPNVIIRNWPRYVLQWGVLIAIIAVLGGLIKSETAPDPETYCPMGGLQAFVTYLVRGSLPCSMSSVQIMMGIALAVGVMLFSKLFCGYICPVGTVEDLLMKLRNALHIKSVRIKNQGIADKALRIFKYILLFWIFYSTATASELFCKNLDPYYAVATGFKGEITLWMSIVTVCMVVIGGVVIDNFWCRYICPLGAASNTLKFWVWVVVLGLAYWVLQLLGVNVPWWLLLGAFCVMGYLLEILSRPRFQLLYVQKDLSRCNKCARCEKQCPHHIRLTEMGKCINSVDCTLCGDCVAACTTGALHVGVSPRTPKSTFSVLLPACITVILGVCAYFASQKYELPTINEQWGIYSDDSLHTQLVDPSTLETVKLENLKQIHCYGSSMAFKGKLEKIRGVYGVKTYVRSHSALVTYDPAKTDPDKIMEAIYTPSYFKANTPDFHTVPELKVLTIRTEKMPSPTDVNMLGIQFKQVDSLIYGLSSEWECPLIVRMYVDPAFDRDAKWLKEIVEKPTLDLENAKGEIKSTPLGFEFVRLEKEVQTIPTTEFLEMMFSRPFTAEFASRVEEYEGQQQYIYEIADENWSKPIISRNLPFVSNHLSRHDGIIGVYTRLNKDYVPALMVRYAAPMTADKIWSELTLDEWTITYSAEDVRTEPAKVKFKKKGVSYKYEGYPQK